MRRSAGTSSKSSDGPVIGTPSQTDRRRITGKRKIPRYYKSSGSTNLAYRPMVSLFLEWIGLKSPPYGGGE